MFLSNISASTLHPVCFELLAAILTFQSLSYFWLHSLGYFDQLLDYIRTHVFYNTFVRMLYVALQYRENEFDKRAADMYSFAITMWEICTGEVPYGGMPVMKVGLKVHIDQSMVGETKSYDNINTLYTF